MDRRTNERLELCLRKFDEEMEKMCSEEKFYNYFSLLSGSSLFVGSCAWTISALETELSRTNVALSIAACSIGASLSAAALANLIYMWRIRKLSLKNCASFGNSLKAAKNTMNILATGMKGRTKPASRKLALDPNADGVKVLTAEENKELVKNITTELGALKDKIDASQELCNHSQSPDDSFISENQKLLAELSKELNKMGEDTDIEVDSSSPKQKNPPLSEKNAKLCKDIAAVLKQCETPARPSCTKDTCLFCSRDSREQITKILQDHENYINGSQQNFTLESSLSIPPFSTDELLGLILQTQVSCVFSDYERHRLCGSIDNKGQNSDVAVLYKLLRIVLEDFPKKAELAGLVGIPQFNTNDLISERLNSIEKVVSDENRMVSAENSFIQRIENAVEKGEHRIQKNIIEKFEELSNRFQRLQESKVANSILDSHGSPFTNGLNRDNETEGTDTSTSTVFKDLQNCFSGTRTLMDELDVHFRNKINLPLLPTSVLETKLLEDKPSPPRTADVDLQSVVEHSELHAPPGYPKDSKMLSPIAQDNNGHEISNSELYTILTSTLVTKPVTEETYSDMIAKESESNDVACALEAETVSSIHEPLNIDSAEEASEVSN